MKISYITRVRMPTEKAHGLQIVKMCEAYGKLGHDVELVVPFRKNHISENVFAYYGVAENFSVRTVPIPDTIVWATWLPSFAFWTQAVLFLTSLKKYPVSKETIIMTRSFDVAWWYTRRGYTVVCEVHDLPRTRKWFSIFLLKNVQHIVVNSKGMGRELALNGIKNIIVAPNGVDLETLTPTIDRVEMRKRCGISVSDYILMYIGALENWKGYQTLLDASTQLTSVKVVIIGGKDAHVTELRKKYPRVQFLGTIPFRDIGNYQNMADALVIPNDPSFSEAQKFTSPIKLFTHLVSGVPIIVTDLPTIRDVVSEKEVTFFDGSVGSLTEVITQVKNNREEALQRAKSARLLADAHTWIGRAQNILNATLLKK